VPNVLQTETESRGYSQPEQGAEHGRIKLLVCFCLSLCLDYSEPAQFMSPLRTIKNSPFEILSDFKDKDK
jgi:hypothetical protein